MSAYRLPPPWNPGYALPQNVEDEGLERHAYVTEWAPRGTFDNPKVGDGGYSLPGYVRAEQYGRGAYVTKWAPRGSYPGPSIPHWLDAAPRKLRPIKRAGGGKTKAFLHGLGASEARMSGRAPLTEYANTLAYNLIDTVRMMPDAMRKKELRKALNAIDPKLYARAEKYAQEEERAGAPALVALQRGIARAAAEGLGTELVDLGKGKKPARQSQLGAAMYGLGAAPTIKIDMPGIKDGQCYMEIDKDLQAKGIYPWKAMRWNAKLNKGEDFVDNTGRQLKDACSSWQGQMNVGGFIFSVDPKLDTKMARIRWTNDRGKLPDQLRQIALTALTTDCEGCASTSMVPLAGHKIGALKDFIPELRDEVNQDVVGGVQKYLNKDGRTGCDAMSDVPIAYFRHPVLHEDWGLFMTLTADKPLDHFGDKNPPYLCFQIGKIPGGFWRSFLKGLTRLAIAIVHFVEDAIKWVADNTCDLLCSQYGAAAGAAAGAATGAAFGGAKGAQTGAQVGAVGAQIAAQACNCGGDAPPPAASPQSSSVMPLLLIGGGAIAGFYYLNKKK
jgi:hypothetical protein